MPYHSFEEFLKTRRAVDDLEGTLRLGCWDRPVPGLVYAGDLYIEGSDLTGYCLTLMNESWSTNCVNPEQRRSLEDLEVLLYDFACQEGWI